MGGLVIDNSLNTPVINLSGYVLDLGKEGIVNNSVSGAEIYGGVLTSSKGFVNLGLKANTGARYKIKLTSVISDTTYRKVGFRVIGDHTGFAHISIEGNKKNTFTGDLEVEGTNTILDLRKAAGVVSVLSNAFIRRGAVVNIWSSNQFSDTSRVSLEDQATLAVSSENNRSTDQSLRRLSIKGGGGILQFDKLFSPNVKKHLYLDDLVIEDGASLLIRDWREGVDFLLIRKDSAHLADALKKIRFDGYDPNAIHLEDYNAEYWQISGTPEPAVYGGALSALGLGAVLWRKRKKRRGSSREPLG